MLGTLLSTGLVVWIGAEALINMSVMVGLLPFAGNALPFVSAGGSNLVATLAAIGILFNVSRQHGEANLADEEWRSYRAPVDLRGWNRRRDLPRPGNPERLGRRTSGG
jgi:cell division protein FtsW